MSEATLVEERDAGLTREQVAANLLAWVHDLETTDAKQGKRTLRSAEDEYCCLGRLCEISNLPWEDLGDRYAVPEEFDAGELYSSSGLTASDVFACIDLNDKEGKTFPEIAAWLRANVLPRYATT